MTTKEIAEAAGVTPETVRVKGKELFPERFVNGRKTEFNQKEAVSIMSELRKKGFIQPTENLEVPTENLEVVTRGDLAAFGAAIVSEMMKQFLPLIQNSKTSTPQIEAPKLETRDELRRIVAKAGKASGDYSGAWNVLYQEIYYRMHRNVNECAKNRGMDKLDYIESEGILPEVIAIAREIFA